MNARKRKEPDQIYKEVKDYDLVLTVDAPLADALNARLDKAIIGEFAETPRRYAFNSEAEEIDFKREIFLEIIEKTDLSWKQASYMLETVLDSWKNTGNLYSILEDEQFAGEAAEQIVKILESTNNPFRALENAQIPENKDVVVVAPYQFNKLDKKILPEEYDTVEIFTEREYELPEFNIFSSASGVIEALKRNIDENNADNIALVVDSNTRYQSLIESAFKSNEIPYNTTVNLSEKEDVRTFVSLARLALAKDRIRLRDVEPVAQHLGFHSSNRKANVKFTEVDDERLSDFTDFLNVISYLNFKEFLDGYEELLGYRPPMIGEVLADLGLSDEPVNEDTISQLEYYLDSFDPSHETREKGVLLASPESTVYIDRPVVFYIGMSSEWTKEVDQRPWIEREEVEDRNLQNFEAMIQNGKQKFYMVQDREMNEEISPCFYFTELYGLESFQDHKNSRYSLPMQSEVEGFERKPLDIKNEKVEMLSQTSLNRFVQSPKAYYFSRLVKDSEKDVMVKGNLFHEFAEFYVNFPEFVEEKGDENFIEIMKKEIEPYVDGMDLDSLETEFRIGINNIKAFIDSRSSPDEIELDPEEGRDENVFAEAFGKEMEKHFAELEFSNKDLHSKGKIDLVLGNELVDYKSSSRSRSKKKIVRDANVELYGDNPDFQPLMYLCELRDKKPGKKLKFTYFYFLSDMASDINSEGSNEDKTVSVTYYPETFDQKIQELEVFEKMIRGVAKSNDRRKTLEKLGHPNFQEFFEKNKIPHPYNKAKLIESEFGREFIRYAKEHVGDYKYVENGAEKTLSKLVEFRLTNFFKEDLDRFEDFLEDEVEKLNEYKKTEFPVGGNDLKRNPYRDMIME
ncbi:PD-(D/E)XK nuclease family protein [Candidatus Nanohalovita haloferacivicina]|uniref:PD-(D/E)XK nuclease family protein n=1 Tax=Candidatus Nanohalovita haloferacivicina TaxID=2978046 RepID=UPI00325F9AE1|nr:PD-D/EXK nuclease superfamily protein [Candidatus Nanohalobia archaeon BNXNv]